MAKLVTVPVPLAAVLYWIVALAFKELVIFDTVSIFTFITLPLEAGFANKTVLDVESALPRDFADIVATFTMLGAAIVILQRPLP